MAKTKDISRRIKSINNTKKITKAMEMVAAVKMRKAVEAVLATRTYSNLSWELILNLAKMSQLNGSATHPLLVKRTKAKKVAIILITSNRGLCGSLNASVIMKAKESLEKHHIIDNQEVENSFILIGKKGEIFYNYKGAKVIAEFPKADIITSTEEIIPVAKLVIEDYLASKYDKVFLAYTDFINPAKQVPRVKQLLPVDIESEDKYLGVVGKSAQVGVTKEFIEYKEEKHLHSGKYVHEYTFEPNPQEVLDMIIPRLIEIQLYQALLESTASEHSARMTAMHQATESANDMVNELTLFYNKARQAGITAEIAEISAGANALAEV